MSLLGPTRGDESPGPSPDGPVLPPVGQTAVSAARVRAHESVRPDRLFEDPLAARLVAGAAAGAGNGAADRPPGERTGRQLALAFHVIVRTRFYDDFLLAAARDGVRQIVLLGAGLDSRAYRLAWPPGTRVYEVDLPPVLAYKQNVLTGGGQHPTCDRHPVPADLAGEWSAGLMDAGFQPAAPTAWLAEGVLVYLDGPAAEQLLSQVTNRSGPGSRLALEGGRPGRRPAGIAPATADSRPVGVEALWRGGLDGDPADWLAAAGWRPLGHPLADLARDYGRPASRPSHSTLLTATRA